MAIKQKSDVSLPELLFTGKGDPAADRKVIRLASDGLLLKLYQGIYTSNLASPPEAVVLRHWASIVSHLLPDGVLSYRSGYDAKPVEGRIYVTRGDRPRTLELPGLAIKLIPGPGAVEGDTPYKGFFLASQSRWLLENLATGRGVGERTLSQEVLESELDKVLSIRGEYLLPLKSLSNHADATPYIRAMTRIQAWTAAFDYTRPRHELHQALKQCNAFEEDLRNYRLVFPEDDGVQRIQGAGLPGFGLVHDGVRHRGDQSG